MKSLLHEGCSMDALRALIPPSVYIGPKTPKRQHEAPADGTNGWTNSNWVAVPTSGREKKVFKYIKPPNKLRDGIDA